MVGKVGLSVVWLLGGSQNFQPDILTLKKKNCSMQGFFSKVLMGGLKIFGPHRSPMGTKSDGGLAKTAHLMQI